MYLLKFWLEWGPKGLGALWLVYLVPAIILTTQAIIGSKSGWYKVTRGEGYTEGKENMSLWKSNKMRIVYAITALAILIHCIIRYEWFGGWN